MTIRELMTLALCGEVTASHWGKCGTVDSTAPLDKLVMFFFDGEGEHEGKLNYPQKYWWDGYVKLKLDLEPNGSGTCQYHYNGIDGQWTSKYPEYYADAYTLKDIVNIDKEDFLHSLYYEDWIWEGFLDDFIQGKGEPWMCTIPIGNAHILAQTFFA